MTTDIVVEVASSGAVTVRAQSGTVAVMSAGDGVVTVHMPWPMPHETYWISAQSSRPEFHTALRIIYNVGGPNFDVVMDEPPSGPVTLFISAKLIPRIVV